jgi:iron complex transport system permease protein
MRVPYVWAALITGSCLAVSGLILQSLTNNDLVDSSLLGVNAGASLGAVILIGLSGLVKTISVDRWLPAAAVVGACISLLLVMLIGKSGTKMQILLGGVALTALLNGIILMIQLRMDSFDFDKILVWLSGSFWNTEMAFLRPYAGLTVLLLGATWLLHRELAVLVLGDQMARSAGVNLTTVKRLLMFLAVAMAAVAVSVGGAISLVGLMAPNMARRFCGSRIQVLLPVTCLLGCVIMVLATVVANNLFLPSVLPVGLVVAVITMPYFLYQLFKG